MKMKLLQTIGVIVFFFFGSLNMEAQNSDAIPKALTADQTALIKAQRDLIVANREAFKASLSAEQLAILANPKLNAKQQQAVLLSSLTNEQKQLLADSKEKAKQLKEEFRSSLTEEQRQQIRLLNEQKIRESVQESRNRFHKRN
jgi:hypothetical protein